MAHIMLFDDQIRDHLLPFTFTRPVGELRIGALTIREKWERWMDMPVCFITQDYLARKYPIDEAEESFIINGSVLPSPQLCALLRQMEFGEAFLDGDQLIAVKLSAKQLDQLVEEEYFEELHGFDLENTEYVQIKHLWDLYGKNGYAIEQDFELLTRGRKSEELPPSNQLIGDPARLFIEAGARVEGSLINVKHGPVYLGREAEVMEGCLLRGGLCIGARATLKMGTKIYGPTTIGPHCRIGGEVKNSVFYGNSNKSHDGYLGNSVIGEWCNLGADTNASNLKNTLSEVKLWNYQTEYFKPTGEQFCGLFMGDHSKCGINSMFNTGTVVGLCANIFGGGFPPRFIPSFTWGGAGGLQSYEVDKAFESMERMMALRNLELGLEDRLILLRIFEDTARYRGEEV